MPSMSIMRATLMRMFGRPQGALGRLGGLVMARMNTDCGAWVVELREVGFGSGVVVQDLSQLVSAGHVAGIDASQLMLEVRPTDRVLARDIEAEGERLRVAIRIPPAFR